MSTVQPRCWLWRQRHEPDRSCRSRAEVTRAWRPLLTGSEPAEMVLRCVPVSLATDPVERVVVVMKDGAAREAPLAAVLFDQLARVAAGRKATVVAVL